VFKNSIHTSKKKADLSLQRWLCCFCWEKYCLRKKRKTLSF